MKFATPEEMKSDLINLCLSSEINKHLPLEQRVQKIQKCAKTIQKRTNSKPVRNLCRKVRSAYPESIIKTLNNTGDELLCL